MREQGKEMTEGRALRNPSMESSSLCPEHCGAERYCKQDPARLVCVPTAAAELMSHSGSSPHAFSEPS